jgi:hypothetical protein
MSHNETIDQGLKVLKLKNRKVQRQNIYRRVSSDSEGG